MSLEAFKRSQPLTLGVELELQLVSPSDHDLVDASPDMLELLARRPFPGNVVPEIAESMIEISTGIHHEHATLLAQLREIRDALVHAGDRLNVGVCGGGTHPFQVWSERRIFSKPRFREVSALYGYLAKQFTIFHHPPEDLRVDSLREDILATLRKVEPLALATDSAPALEHLCATAHEGSDASFLRAQHEACGHAEGMVDAALKRFRSAPGR